MEKHRKLALIVACVLMLTACSGKQPNANATNSAAEATTAEVIVVGPDVPANAATEATTEPEPEHTYADVLPDDPSYEAIESAAAKGLLEGFTKDDKFRPDDHLTNADMALLFYNMAGRPELTEEAEALQIANLEEANEEQAIAIRWYNQAFASYGFTTEGDETNFLPPDSPTRNVDFSNTVFLATEQFEKDSPLTDEYAEYRSPDEEEPTDITRVEAVELVDDLTDTFPVGTEMVNEIPEEILAQINPPEEKPVEVAVQPTPAPAPAPAPQQQDTQQTQDTPPAPQPAPAPAPAPAPEPAPAPAPAGDMNNVQWVRDQIAGHAEACGFYCSQPAGSQISLSANDLNRTWAILDFQYMGNGTWGLYALIDFFHPSELVYVSSIGEITSFISSHAY